MGVTTSLTKLRHQTDSGYKDSFWATNRRASASFRPHCEGHSRTSQNKREECNGFCSIATRIFGTAGRGVQAIRDRPILLDQLRVNAAWIYSRRIACYLHHGLPTTRAETFAAEHVSPPRWTSHNPGWRKLVDRLIFLRNPPFKIIAPLS